MNIQINDYWWVNLSPVKGEEMGGHRLCKIIDKKDNLIVIIPYEYKNCKYTPCPFHQRTISTERLIQKFDFIFG